MEVIDRWVIWWCGSTAVSRQKEGDGADRWAQYGLALEGCDQHDQGVTRVDAIGQARASIDVDPGVQKLTLESMRYCSLRKSSRFRSRVA